MHSGSRQDFASVEPANKCQMRTHSSGRTACGDAHPFHERREVDRFVAIV